MLTQEMVKIGDGIVTQHTSTAAVPFAVTKTFLAHTCILGTTVEEKDLVTISADMKEQCGIAASKGNQTLWLIRRNITYKEKS